MQDLKEIRKKAAAMRDPKPEKTDRAAPASWDAVFESYEKPEGRIALVPGDPDHACPVKLLGRLAAVVFPAAVASVGRESSPPEGLAPAALVKWVDAAPRPTPTVVELARLSVAERAALKDIWERSLSALRDQFKTSWVEGKEARRAQGHPLPDAQDAAAVATV